MQHKNYMSRYSIDADNTRNFSMNMYNLIIDYYSHQGLHYSVEARFMKLITHVSLSPLDTWITINKYKKKKIKAK